MINYKTTLKEFYDSLKEISPLSISFSGTNDQYELQSDPNNKIKIDFEEDSYVYVFLAAGLNHLSNVQILSPEKNGNEIKSMTFSGMLDNGNSNTVRTWGADDKKINLDDIKLKVVLSQEKVNADIVCAAAIQSAELSGLTIAGLPLKAHDNGGTRPFNLQIDGKPAVSVKLSEICDTVGWPLSEYLYILKLIPNYDAANAADLESCFVIFGKGQKSYTRFEFCTEVFNEWDIVDGPFPLSLNSIKLKWTMSYLLVDGTTSSSPGISVAIMANVTVLGKDFSVEIRSKGGNWFLKITPAAGGLYPGLSELAGKLGGSDLAKKFTSALSSLNLDLSPHLPAIQSIEFSINPKEKKLIFICTDVIVNIFDINLRLNIYLPDFNIFGKMADNKKNISLRDFVGKCGFSNPKIIPDLIITTLEFFGYPGQASYGMKIGIKDDPGWNIISIGTKNISLKEVFLELDKSGNDITGLIKAELNIAGVDIFVLAQHPVAGAGWQFSGTTGLGQEIPIGLLIDELAAKFGLSDTSIPASIKDLVIENLSVSFNTGNRDFTFSCETSFPVGDEEAHITLTIDLKQRNGNYTKDMKILIGDLEFDLHFEENLQSNFFAATYSHRGDGGKKINDLIGCVLPGLAAHLPEIEIDLKDVKFIRYKEGLESKFALGMGLSTHFSLSDLPLIGDKLPDDAAIGVNDLQVLYCSKSFTAAQVDKINPLLPQGVTRLPSAPAGQTGGEQTPVLGEGLTISANMQLGKEPRPLGLPMASQPVHQPTRGHEISPTHRQPAAGSTRAIWFNLQKNRLALCISTGLALASMTRLYGFSLTLQ